MAGKIESVPMNSRYIYTPAGIRKIGENNSSLRLLFLSLLPKNLEQRQMRGKEPRRRVVIHPTPSLKSNKLNGHTSGKRQHGGIL
jgi:hypothetical protein